MSKVVDQAYEEEARFASLNVMVGNDASAQGATGPSALPGGHKLQWHVHVRKMMTLG